MGRTEYWNDPDAPKPNSLVPACGVLAVDEAGRILLQRRRDTGQWALPMGKMELGETPSQCAIRINKSAGEWTPGNHPQRGLGDPRTRLPAHGPF